MRTVVFLPKKYIMDISVFENKIFTLLFLAAVVHSFYLASLLFIKSQKERGLGWLGLLMIPVALLLLTYLLYLTDTIRVYPHLYGAFMPILYLIGPAFYFFIRQSSSTHSRYYWYDLLHLLPVLYVFFEWLPVYAWPAETKLAIIERSYAPNKSPFIELIKANRNNFIILIYALFSFFKLKSVSQSNDNQDVRINWLLKFSAFFGGVILLKILLMIAFWNFDWNGSTFEFIAGFIISYFYPYFRLCSTWKR